MINNSIEFYKEETNLYFDYKNIKFIVKFDKNFLFWSSFKSDSWEKNTIAVFEKLINNSTIYVDLGAWIGPSVLYASRIAGKTYAFEPSASAFKTLEYNVIQNYSYTKDKQITLINKAAGLESKIIQIGADDLGNSTDSIFNKTNSYDVEQVDIITFLDNEGAFKTDLFIKIDIEGAEYNLLEELLNELSKNTEFTVFVSTHPIILLKSIAKNKAYISSLFRVIETHFKLLKFFSGYVYSETLKEIRFPLIDTFLALLNKNKSYIFSNHKLI